MSDDVYQERYLEHQARKKAEIVGGAERLALEIFGRRSVRRFKPGRLLAQNEAHLLLEAVRMAPSSCDRQAVYVARVGAARLAYLADCLVGGRGWCNGASEVWLFFADLRAYKSEHELAYMHWLDGGAAVMAVATAAHLIGLASCWICPHVNGARLFDDFCAEYYEACHHRKFVSALAIGEADGHVSMPPKREREQVYAGEMPE